MLVRTLIYSVIALLFMQPVWASADKAQLERPGGEGTIQISITDIPSGDGIMFVSLYLTDEGFPGGWQIAYRTLQLPAADQVDGKMSVTFEDVPAGWFVIAVLHDEDGNKEMKRNFVGIPKEAYGFSQNPKSPFGPPSWDDAAAWLESGVTSMVEIKLK